MPSSRRSEVAHRISAAKSDSVEPVRYWRRCEPGLTGLWRGCHASRILPWLFAMRLGDGVRSRGTSTTVRSRSTTTRPNVSYVPFAWGERTIFLLDQTPEASVQLLS